MQARMKFHEKFKSSGAADRIEETKKRDHQWRLEHAKLAYGAAVEFAKMSLNGLMLINGGAALALLSLLGYIWKDNPDKASVIASKMVYPIGFHAFGTVLAVTAAICTYVAQQNCIKSYSGDTTCSSGEVESVLAFIFAGLAITCFVVGVTWAANVF
jgi:hypothetical protein